MLSAPKYGWTTFQLGQREYRLGYLTDVALEWLTQAIHGLETRDVFSVHGFCEPGRMVCTVSYWSCYILYEGSSRQPRLIETEQHHLSMMDFCKNLYADISNSFEEWLHWDDSNLDYVEDEGDEKTIEALLQERKRDLQSRLDRLKELIDKNEEHFGENRCFF